MFKNTNYFCNSLYLRCLAWFKYTTEEYLFWKYLEGPNFNKTRVCQRKNLKESIIAKASF